MCFLPFTGFLAGSLHIVHALVLADAQYPFDGKLDVARMLKMGGMAGESGGWDGGGGGLGWFRDVGGWWGAGGRWDGGRVRLKRRPPKILEPSSDGC